MDGFRRIMLPIDFSLHCDLAAEYAAWFARATGGTVFVVHVVDNPIEDLYAPQEVTRWELVDHAERKAMELLRASGERCLPADCRREYLVLLGDPYEKLLQAATQIVPDVIVMSTHGRGGVAHLVMGSVAEKMVRHSLCPVFVVRRTEPPRKQTG